MTHARLGHRRRAPSPWRHVLPLAIAAGCALPAAAADYDFGGVDLKACAHWDIVVADLHPAITPSSGTDHLARPQWRILAARNLAVKGDGTYNVSAPCLFDGDILIRCEGALPFPMADASYRNLASSKQDPVYQCAKACDRAGILQQVYDLTGEGVRPSPWHFADQINLYRKRCAARLDSQGFIKAAKGETP